MVDNRDVVQKYVKDSVAALKEELLNHVKKQRTYLDKRFDDIYFDHLWKTDFVGTGSDCEYKSMMEYVTTVIPKLQKELKDQVTAASQSTFTLKDTKARLDKYVKVDAPQHFKKVEDKIKKADHDLKEYKKAQTKELSELSIELSEKFEEAQDDLAKAKKTLSEDTADLETLVKEANEQLKAQVLKLNASLQETDDKSQAATGRLDTKVEAVEKTIGDFTAGVQAGLQALTG
jgi:hypothetical protein